jgi:hypothetical protein
MDSIKTYYLAIFGTSITLVYLNTALATVIALLTIIRLLLDIRKQLKNEDKPKN